MPTLFDPLRLGDLDLPKRVIMAPLTRLTNNTTSIKSANSGMPAVGDTNIPIGLAWGWNTLAPAGPFGDGVAYTDTEHSKIVVLMTDGQNQNSNPGGSNV